MMKRIAIFPGTFDPITLGHLDVINRASSLMDQLIVAVALNTKKRPMFSITDRVNMVKGAIPHKNVSVEMFDGLLADFLRNKNAFIVVRGVRCPADCDRELLMWRINGKILPEIEAIFIPASEKHQYTSSSFVKEIASLGGNVDEFVPKNVAEVLKNNLKKKE